MPSILLARVPVFVDPNDPTNAESYWWYSSTAYVVRWCIVIGFFLAIAMWFALGYIHAKRRLAQGKKPLAYHRFLVPRDQRSGPIAQNDAAYYSSHGGRNNEMQNWQEPPPVYSASDLPPSYQPAAGGSKIPPQYHESPAPVPAQGQQETGRV